MHTEFKSENENLLRTFVKINYNVAHKCEVYTIGEKLVKPCAVDLAACVMRRLP
jgi:hypothetical protein